MKQFLALLVALSLTGSNGFAQAPIPPQQPKELPPPLPPQELQQQPLPANGPQLQPPQQVQQPRDLKQILKARREAMLARKEAAKERMRQFKAAQAEAEQKVYEDWHARYIADAPVRAEYYRAMADAYRADAAIAYERAAYYSYYPPVVYFPVVPIYQPPIAYGTVFWGW